MLLHSLKIGLPIIENNNFIVKRARKSVLIFIQVRDVAKKSIKQL